MNATIALPDATVALPAALSDAAWVESARVEPLPAPVRVEPTRAELRAAARVARREDPYLCQLRVWRQRLAAFLCCTVAGTLATTVMIMGSLLSYELEPGRMPWLSFVGALVFAAATMIAACLFVAESGRRPRRAPEATTTSGWGLW